MNLNQDPTREDLRALVHNCDDTAATHLLWVKKNGDVAISRLPKNLTPSEFEQTEPEMKLRFPAFIAGNEYVGPDAARDEGWISELFERLVQQWEQAKNTSAVEFVDAF